MHRIFLKAACLALLLAVQPAVADSLDLPGNDVLHLPGDGGVDLDGADFEGGLLQRFAQGWPDDLVLAPVPGRSPQVGWSRVARMRMVVVLPAPLGPM